MIARTLTGCVSSSSRRLSVVCTVFSLVIAAILASGLAVGQGPAQASEGDETATGAEASGDLSIVEVTPVPPTATESPLGTEPIEPTPTIAEPSGDTSADDFVSAIEPSPTELPGVEPVGVTDLDPTVEPAPTEPVSSEETGNAVRSAAESTAIQIGDCEVATGSSGAIGQAATGIYVCDAVITVTSMPLVFTELVLDWGVVAEVTPGWTVDLRLPRSEGNGSDQSWAPGAAPGLRVVRHLGPSDDADGNPEDGVFSFVVRFEVRLTAPACGGPVDPDVTITPSVLPTIDGIAGWRRFGDLYWQLQPALAVAAPAPSLSRNTAGALEDAANPLYFSHADQTVDAGTLSLTVTSGYCGGWNVSISGTDFESAAGGAAFGVENLMLTAINVGSGVPHPPLAIALSRAAQPIVAASHQPLPAGAYAYSFGLTLTIPGGTPSGTYTSTLTVTASAAP